MNVGARSRFGGIVFFLLLAGIAPGTAAADGLRLPVTEAPVQSVPAEVPTVAEASAPVASVTQTADAAVDSTTVFVRDVAKQVPVDAAAPVVESVVTVAEAVETTPVVERAAAAADEIVAAVPPDDTVLPAPQAHGSAPTSASPRTNQAAPATPAERTAPAAATAPPTPRPTPATPAGARPAVAARPRSDSSRTTPETGCGVCTPIAASPTPLAPLAQRATVVKAHDAVSAPLPPAPRWLLDVPNAVAAAGFSGTGFLVVTLALFLLFRLPGWLRVPLEPRQLRQSLFLTPLERPG